MLIGMIYTIIYNACCLFNDVFVDKSDKMTPHGKTLSKYKAKFIIHILFDPENMDLHTMFVMMSCLITEVWTNL